MKRAFSAGRLMLDEQASEHFTFRALIECGETYARLGDSVDVLPREAKTWEALARLAQNLLEPLVAEFGRVELTYGFAPPALTRHISARICPSLDQHASCERKASGALVCEREGAAVDLRVPGRSSALVVLYLRAFDLPVDRLYYYGPDRPFHLSWNEQPARIFLEMRAGPSGRLLPRPLSWERLDADCEVKP